MRIVITVDTDKKTLWATDVEGSMHVEYEPFEFEEMSIQEVVNNFLT